MIDVDLYTGTVVTSPALSPGDTLTTAAGAGDITTGTRGSQRAGPTGTSGDRAMATGELSRYRRNH